MPELTSLRVCCTHRQLASRTAWGRTRPHEESDPCGPDPVFPLFTSIPVVDPRLLSPNPVMHKTPPPSKNPVVFGHTSSVGASFTCACLHKVFGFLVPEFSGLTRRNIQAKASKAKATNVGVGAESKQGSTSLPNSKVFAGEDRLQLRSHERCERSWFLGGSEEVWKRDDLMRGRSGGYRKQIVGYCRKQMPCPFSCRSSHMFMLIGAQAPYNAAKWVDKLIASLQSSIVTFTKR